MRPTTRFASMLGRAPTCCSEGIRSRPTWRRHPPRREPGWVVSAPVLKSRPAPLTGD